MNPVLKRRESQRIKDRKSNNVLKKEEQQRPQEEFDSSQNIKKQINTQRYFGANLTNQPIIINLEQKDETLQTMQHQQNPQYFIKNPLITLPLIEQKLETSTKRSQVQIYQSEIANHLHKDLKFNKQIQDYLSHQPQITQQNRQMLVTWLIQIHEQFQLKSQTIFKTIHILDKIMFLQKCQFSKFQFQVLGLVCLYVSSKYQQVTVQDVQRYVSKISLSVSNFHTIQSRVLILMNFDLVTISPLRIMQLYCQMYSFSNKFISFCQCLLWMCLLQYGMCIYYQPQTLGICSILIINSISKQKDQMPQLKEQIIKNQHIFKNCFNDMSSIFQRRFQNKFNILKKKYIKQSTI